MLMAHDLSWHGVIRGAFLLGLLWWSWAAYSWVCNIAKADEGSVRTVLLYCVARSVHHRQGRRDRAAAGRVAVPRHDPDTAMR
jgi:hypothetical protein